MSTSSSNPSPAPGTDMRRASAGALVRWTSRFAWLGAAVAAIGIAVTNFLSSRNDFAAANVLTFMLSVLIWGMLILGVKNSTLPRAIWRALLLLPLIALGVFLSLYSLERLDGDLVPRFRYRWAHRTPLPGTEAQTSTLDPSRLQPAATDYPQFLGPNRNGVIAQTEIDSDWDANAPWISWKKPVGNGWSGFAVQGDVAVTMEQRDEQEWVTAYDIRDGALLWHYAMDSKHTHMLGGTGPRSTPLIAENKVYACSAVSRFACLELERGTEVWTQDLLELSNTSQVEFEATVTWGRSASPLRWNSQIIIPLGGKAPTSSLIAFDMETGTELWRAGDQPISYSSPTLMTFSGQKQLVFIAESSVRAYDPTTQTELWSVDWPGSSSSSANASQPIQVDAQHVFLSKGYGTGCELVKVQKSSDTGLSDAKFDDVEPGDSKSGEPWITEVVWKNELALRTKFTSSVVHQGFAYGLSDGILECVDLSNGEQKWKKGRYRQGQLMLVGSNLLISSEQGQIVLVAADPTAFRELAKLPVIGDVAWNPHALSGNRLLVRNSEEAACVLLPILNRASLTSSSDEENHIVE